MTDEETTDRLARLVIDVLKPTVYGHLTTSQISVYDGYDNLVSISIKNGPARLYYEMRKTTLRHGDHHLRGVIRTAYRNRGVVFP